jgi:hypothetical protein
MELKTRETLYILNRADRDRIDAAVGLLRQVIEELADARAFPVPKEALTPGTLYELAEEAELVYDERRQVDDDF